MFTFWRTLRERLRALFAIDAALDLEAQLLARQAERQAELLRQAARLEEEGWATVAHALRERATTLSVQQPLTSALAALEHLQQSKEEGPTLLPFPRHQAGDDHGPAQTGASPGKKKGR
jgi:hypothetical protein